VLCYAGSRGSHPSESTVMRTRLARGGVAEGRPIDLGKAQRRGRRESFEKLATTVCVSEAARPDATTAPFTERRNIASEEHSGSASIVIAIIIVSMLEGTMFLARERCFRQACGPDGSALDRFSPLWRGF
jgi:hypothetical protein